MHYIFPGSNWFSCTFLSKKKAGIAYVGVGGEEWWVGVWGKEFALCKESKVKKYKNNLCVTWLYFHFTSPYSLFYYFIFTALYLTKKDCCQLGTIGRKRKYTSWPEFGFEPRPQRLCGMSSTRWAAQSLTGPNPADTPGLRTVAKRFHKLLQTRNRSSLLDVAMDFLQFINGIRVCVTLCKVAVFSSGCIFNITSVLDECTGSNQMQLWVCGKAWAPSVGGRSVIAPRPQQRKKGLEWLSLGINVGPGK